MKLSPLLALVALSGPGCVDRSGSEIRTESPEAERREDPQETVAILQIRGVFEPDGKSLRRLHPLRVVHRRAPAPVWAGEGTFRLLVEYDDDSVVELPFDAFAEGDSERARRIFAGFTLDMALPADRSVRSVAITDAEGATVFADWSAEEIPARDGEGGNGAHPGTSTPHKGD